MRLALAHDWLTGMRGGEKCLEVAAELLPNAPLLTLLQIPGRVSSVIESRKIITSPIQGLPGVARYYRSLLPLFPWAVGQLRTDGYDGILSFSHCVVKSLQSRPGARHVCYCFTPMRYLWGLEDQYLASRAGPGGVLRPMLDGAVRLLRAWDRRTAQRVDHFVAISQHIRRRIASAYGRDSELIYPPVDAEFYTLGDDAERPADFYLVVSALAPYKRIDLAIRACVQLGRPLKIIGSGQDELQLRRLTESLGAAAAGLVQFLGHQPDAVLRGHYQRCRALLFPGEEDFGITPLEAQACGRPVIALGVGGACETVIPPESDADRATGVFFAEPTVADLCSAIERFEALQAGSSPIRSESCRRNAERFARPVFKRRLAELIDQQFFRG